MPVHAHPIEFDEPTSDIGTSTESTRERWQHGASFIREMFAGRFHLDRLESLEFAPPERPGFWRFLNSLEEFLQAQVDPTQIDRRGELPSSVLHGLRELGAFGLTIPTYYEGLGMNSGEFSRVMQLLGSRDANLAAVLAAHATMGLVEPLLMFGNVRQKREYLPRCAKGAVSAITLTGPPAELEPARIRSHARLDSDGSHYILDGGAAWCINAGLAELLLVVARDPQTDQFNAFIVEASSPGVSVEHRCRFVGLRAIVNGWVRFSRVRVPRDNRLGPVGAGLRVAEVNLEHRRSALPAVLTGTAKACAELARRWSIPRLDRSPGLAEHAVIAQLNAKIAYSALAMESVADVVSGLAEQQGVDARLEQVVARQWSAAQAKELIDDTLDVFGGLGYETARSARERGGPPLCFERALRDARVSGMLEGVDKTLPLTVARSALDEDLEFLRGFVDLGTSLVDRTRKLARLAVFHLWRHPSRLIGWGRWPRYRAYGDLATHLCFVERRTRRLARAVIRATLKHGSRLEHQGALLVRVADIAMELFSIAAMTLHVHHQCRAKTGAIELADLFARAARERVDEGFRSLWDNDDGDAYDMGRLLLGGRFEWLEAGIVPLAKEPVKPPSSSFLNLVRAEIDVIADGPKLDGVPEPCEVDEWAKTQDYPIGPPERPAAPPDEPASSTRSPLLVVLAEPENDEAETREVGELDAEELAQAGIGRVRRWWSMLALLLVVAGGLAAWILLEGGDPLAFSIEAGRALIQSP